jgi:hypothetical protein
VKRLEQEWQLKKYLGMARRIVQGVRACQNFLNASEQLAGIVELRADFPCT